MTAVRLFLHVLAASIWVGGLLVMGGLVPTIRRFGDDAPRQVALALNRIAWPAYGVAVVTGLWNVFALPLDDLVHPAIELKVLAVALSGAGAAVHQVAKGNTAMRAGGAAVATLFAVVSMYLGFVVTVVP